MSLRDKYTPEEWDAKENEISQKKNKRNASLDMYELLKPIEKPGIKYEETEAGKKEFEGLVNYGIQMIEYKKQYLDKLKAIKTTEESYNSTEPSNLIFDEIGAFKHRKGRDILDAITHKVYECKFDNKCPNVAILSSNDYHDLGIISDFHLDYITVMGCKLKIHVSPNAEDGNVEIY